MSILIAGYSILLIWLFIAHGNEPDYLRHQKILPIAALILFIIQLLMVVLFIKRRAWLGSKAEVAPAEFLKLFSLNVVSVPASEQKVEQRFFNLFNWLAGAGIAVYLLATFSIYFADGMGPIAFALVAFGVLVGFANIITYFSIKLNINLYVLLLLLAIIVGEFYNPYNVNLLPAKEKDIYGKRPDLKTYLERWVMHRRDAIEKVSEYPVYLFLADGGASRSGYWVASVLAGWEDGSRQLTENDSLSAHTFCLSGTSGGGLGNATFYALLRQKLDHQNLLISWRTKQFLGSDFLTYTLSHYLGPDLLRHIIPLPVNDRAAALENVIAHTSDKYLFGAFQKPLSTILDYTGRLPILFVNTTEVQEGSPAIISSIRTRDFTSRLDVLAEVDSTGYGKKPKGDLSLSTAVIMGARFPYVSPAGAMRNYYFVDGGYFDNSGAGVVHEMMQRLEVIIAQTKDKELKDLYKKLCFRLVHISNTPSFPQGAASIHPLKNDIAAPLVTVLNTYTSQTMVNDQRLNQFLEQFEYGEVRPEINLFTLQDSIVYPMNWVISDFNLERMNRRVDKVMSELRQSGEMTFGHYLK